MEVEIWGGWIKLLSESPGQTKPKFRPRISSGLSFSLDPVLLHKLWHMQAIVQQQLTWMTLLQMVLEKVKGLLLVYLAQVDLRSSTETLLKLPPPTPSLSYPTVK